MTLSNADMARVLREVGYLLRVADETDLNISERLFWANLRFRFFERAFLLELARATEAVGNPQSVSDSGRATAAAVPEPPSETAIGDGVDLVRATMAKAALIAHTIRQRHGGRTDWYDACLEIQIKLEELAGAPVGVPPPDRGTHKAVWPPVDSPDAVREGSDSGGDDVTSDRGAQEAGQLGADRERGGDSCRPSPHPEAAVKVSDSGGHVSNEDVQAFWDIYVPTPGGHFAAGRAAIAADRARRKIVVTEAMVERACKTLFKGWEAAEKITLGVNMELRGEMRRALEAALGGEK